MAGIQRQYFFNGIDGRVVFTTFLLERYQIYSLAENVERRQNRAVYYSFAL